MEIKKSEFIKGIIGTDKILNDEKPQVVFIGRSNVGKSSVINALVKRKNLAESGSKPGKTQQLNFYLINNKIYFVDLPGYGFVKMSLKQKEKIRRMILWYLFNPDTNFKIVVLIIDALVGPSKFDKEILGLLNKSKYPIVLVANKIDKLKKNELLNQLKVIQSETGQHEIIPFSAKTKKGRIDLMDKIFIEINKQIN